jgi:hypothetical protein
MGKRCCALNFRGRDTPKLQIKKILVIEMHTLRQARHFFHKFNLAKPNKANERKRTYSTLE